MVYMEKALNEDWYNSCMNCGSYMKPKDPYDFWCSKKCKILGERTIKRLGKELAKTHNTV